jgi:hypothetical protein
LIHKWISSNEIFSWFTNERSRFMNQQNLRLTENTVNWVHEEIVSTATRYIYEGKGNSTSIYSLVTIKTQSIMSMYSSQISSSSSINIISLFTFFFAYSDVIEINHWFANISRQCCHKRHFWHASTSTEALSAESLNINRFDMRLLLQTNSTLKCT